METIADPKNGKIYSIFSEAGKNILRNYVNKYKLGGNKIKSYEIFCKNTENGPVCSPNRGALIRGPAGLPRQVSGPIDSIPHTARRGHYESFGNQDHHIMTLGKPGYRPPNDIITNSGKYNLANLYNGPWIEMTNLDGTKYIYNKRTGETKSMPPGGLRNGWPAYPNPPIPPPPV